MLGTYPLTLTFSGDPIIIIECFGQDAGGPFQKS